MEDIKLVIKSELNKSELAKLISYVSPEIISYQIVGTEVGLRIKDGANVEKIRENFQLLMENYCSTADQEEIIFSNRKNRNYKNKEEIFASEQIINFREGLIGFTGTLYLLYQFFEEIFRKIALSAGALERKYPTMLPINAYKKTGYLKLSPQYATFCCDLIADIGKIMTANETIEDVNAILNRSEYALSPSACFHTYAELEGKSMKDCTTFTFEQRVFRNEGRFNWDELGRLRDYSVREIVFIGTEEYVFQKRQEIIDATIVLLKELELCGCIKTASDPFIMPIMQRYKKLQLSGKIKYEAKLNINEEEEIAVASYNYHGISFTKPFSISLEGQQRTVTGCVGFGIERWVIAFLAQYGLDERNWPLIVKSMIEVSSNTYKEGDL